MTSSPPSSPPPSPQAPRLNTPTLSRILLWGARGSRKAVAHQDSQDGSAPTAPPSPSGTAKKPVKANDHEVECSSGTELKTHPRIIDANPECRDSDVIMHRDVFVCLDGVDTRRLLLLTRRRVFEKVELLGGNAIIDERWSCKICKHETRRGIVYRISITYQGTPARCSCPDPQRPVAIDEAKGIQGLMSVVSRHCH
ncbi:hypothetical protein JB92DRAFT_2890475 [Gautieria morchelliformis]|nr:hypothetical protein JB92DRAFT_2890475 [Gautieria morchelliformis]